MGALERAVESALDKRVFVLMCTVIFSAAGIWAFLTMRVDAVPDISNVQVTVTATARGLAPTEIGRAHV